MQRLVKIAMRSNAEVVVIGGGIIGTAIAYNLAKKGVRDVVLVEKGFLASGSTGRCGAGVRTQWGTEMNCLLAKKSLELLENINEELDYEGDCEFKQGGYLLLAYTEKEVNQFKKNVELQNRLGIPSRLISIDDAKEIVPFLNTDGVLSGAFCQKDGHANPFLVVQAYANAAKRLGVEINTFTTVKDIVTENGKVKSVVTDKGVIKTHRVVNAAGGYAQVIARMAGLRLPNYAERHQILVTEPVNPILKPMVMSFSANYYIQQTPHGSFIMGYGDGNEKPGFNIDSEWEFLEVMSKKAVTLLPPLGGLRIVRQWAGLYEMTPDRQPIIGDSPELEGYYVATGFSGHGFMLGPVTGMLMSELMTGEKPSIDISSLDAGRFDRGELVWEPSVV
jgi:sarcosine oxidase subunit beta